LDALGFTGGVNYVYNTQGTNEYWEALSEVLKPKGHAVLINETSTPVPLGIMMVKRISISYELMFTAPLFNADPELQGEILDTVGKLIDTGVLKPLIKLNLMDLNEENLRKAHAQVESGSTIGKIALKL